MEGDKGRGIQRREKEERERRERNFFFFFPVLVDFPSPSAPKERSD